jgi:restriction system protein
MAVMVVSGIKPLTPFSSDETPLVEYPIKRRAQVADKGDGGIKPVNASVPFIYTSGDYTNEAREFSVDKHIKLMRGTELLKQIRELPEASQTGLLEKITSGDYTTPSCPSCGIKMAMRTTRKGSTSGNKFWGCRNYPKCRNTLRIRN